MARSPFESGRSTQQTFNAEELAAATSAAAPRA